MLFIAVSILGMSNCMCCSSRLYLKCKRNNGVFDLCQNQPHKILGLAHQCQGLATKKTSDLATNQNPKSYVYVLKTFLPGCYALASFGI